MSNLDSWSRCNEAFIDYNVCMDGSTHPWDHRKPRLSVTAVDGTTRRLLLFSDLDKGVPSVGPGRVILSIWRAEYLKSKGDCLGFKYDKQSFKWIVRGHLQAS